MDWSNQAEPIHSGSPVVQESRSEMRIRRGRFQCAQMAVVQTFASSEAGNAQHGPHRARATNFSMECKDRSKLKGSHRSVPGTVRWTPQRRYGKAEWWSWIFSCPVLSRTKTNEYSAMSSEPSDRPKK